MRGENVFTVAKVSINSWDLHCERFWTNCQLDWNLARPATEAYLAGARLQRLPALAKVSDFFLNHCLKQSYLTFMMFSKFLLKILWKVNRSCFKFDHWYNGLQGQIGGQVKWKASCLLLKNLLGRLSHETYGEKMERWLWRCEGWNYQNHLYENFFLGACSVQSYVHINHPSFHPK